MIELFCKSNMHIMKRTSMLYIMLVPFGLIMVFGFFIVGCKHDADLSDFPPVCFDSEVLPVFQSSCGYAGCHDASSATAGVVLDSYSEIIKHVSKGNSRNSKAYEAILSSWEPMPPDRPLPKDLRTTIRIWIDQGAYETMCDTAGHGNPPVYAACFNRDVLPVMLSSCAISGCHDASTSAEGIQLTSFQTVMQGGVTPYQPNNSKLYKVISKLSGNKDLMPPSPYQKLPQPVIDSISRWIFLGAKNENCAMPCDTLNTITYTAHLSSIIQSSCVSCHSGGGPSGGILLTNYAEVLASANTGKLIPSINRSGFAPMPPSSSLTKCQIRQFERWNLNGKPQN